MPASNIDLQKIENLLRSATNERQRKMYQSLLDKAQKSKAAEATVSVRETAKATVSQNGQKNPSQTSSSRQNSVVSRQSPPQHSEDKADSGSRAKTKQTKSKKSQPVEKVLPVETVVNKPASSQNKLKSSKKKQSNKKTTSAKDNSDKDEQNTAIPQAELALQPKSQKRKELVPSDTPSTTPQAKPDNTQIFQALGLVKGTPQLKDDKLCVRVGDCLYDLTKTGHFWHKDCQRLKQELETNGSREMLLQVYPNITHRSDNSEKSYQYSFSLVRAYIYESPNIDREEKFIFRGIWQYVPYCDRPVILIYRNLDTLKLYKRLSPTAKRSFTKPQAFPLVWEDAAVEPFCYNPELKKSEQMPRYFVQVKVVFKDGQYKVVQMLEKPTLEIPKYVKPIRKKTQVAKSKSDSK